MSAESNELKYRVAPLGAPSCFVSKDYDSIREARAAADSILSRGLTDTVDILEIDPNTGISKLCATMQAGTS